MKQKESQKLGRKLGLGIKSPVPHSVSAATESHVKNYTAAPASRQLQRGVSEWRLCGTGTLLTDISRGTDNFTAHG